MRDRVGLPDESCEGLDRGLRREQPTAISPQVLGAAALERLTQDKRDLLARFLLSGMRSERDLLAAEQEFHDRVWYTHLEHLRRLESGDEPPSRLPPLPPGFEAAPAFEATRLTPEQSLRLIGEHAREERPDLRDAESDFEVGFWSGKLSALRWVLGDEWDNLDT